YNQLGLNDGSTLKQVKESYRRLARMYHPDVNPCDRYAQEKFIAITDAYKFLLTIAPSEVSSEVRSTVTINSPVASRTTSSVAKTTSYQSPQSSQTSQSSVQTTSDESTSPSFIDHPHLSDYEQKLKHDCYLHLQQLIKYQRFPRAIALVEGLVQRLPQDREVKQWQAIAYQRWGRHLLNEGKLDKARSYLKKAVKTDPHNRALWEEVERDLQRLEQIF
ncbi:MAG: DnaJ domain-containing protein, partial [Microcoleaceae cyanobacterium]